VGGVTAGLTGEPTLELPAMREVRTPGHARVLAWLVVGLAMLAGLVLLVPWQQTARATGKVTALDPNERQQVLDAPVEGRVARVHVTEGQRVEEGDLLLELTDNDPLVLERLDAEQQAFAQRVASARSAVLELEGRILDLQEARIRAVSAAEARVTSARDRARAAAERIPEAQAQLDRDEAQLTRP
jgi:adhesin transport system membrane fusion protein